MITLLRWILVAVCVAGIALGLLLLILPERFDTDEADQPGGLGRYGNFTWRMFEWFSDRRVIGGVMVAFFGFLLVCQGLLD